MERIVSSLMRPLLDRFPRLATLYRRVRDQLDYMEVPRQTPWGFKLAGNQAMAEGTFEPKETELVRAMLKDVDILVNIGANIGYYCCHALSMGVPVIAFEPVERNLQYLCKNIQANGWSGAEIFPIALSKTIGIMEIYGGNTGASLIKGWAGIPESYKTLAPSSTMDVVLGTRLHGKRALILADIEGAEKWMLEGASIMLANEPKPIWLVEIVSNEIQLQGVEMNPNFMRTFQLFFQNGYDAFDIKQDMRQITLGDVSRIARGNMKSDSYNFIFYESKKKKE